MSDPPQWGELDLDPVALAPEKAPGASRMDRSAPQGDPVPTASPSLFQGGEGVLDEDPLAEGQSPLELAVEQMDGSAPQPRTEGGAVPTASPGLFQGGEGVLDEDPLAEGQSPLELAVEPSAERKRQSLAGNALRPKNLPAERITSPETSPYPAAPSTLPASVPYFWSVTFTRLALRAEGKEAQAQALAADQKHHTALSLLGRSVADHGWQTNVDDGLQDAVRAALSASEASQTRGAEASGAEQEEIQSLVSARDAHDKEAARLRLSKAPLAAQAEADKAALRRIEAQVQRTQIELRNLPQSDTPANEQEQIFSRLSEQRSQRDAAASALERSLQALGESERLEAVESGHAGAIEEKLQRQRRRNQKVRDARDAMHAQTECEVEAAFANVGLALLEGPAPEEARDRHSSARRSKARLLESQQAYESLLARMSTYDSASYRRGGVLSAAIALVVLATLVAVFTL